MAEWTAQLNEAQREAVFAIDGPVLVIAGAGSGKTRVIEYRVLNLVENGINPASILLLTFTRKAANLMKSRAAQHNANCRNIQGGTFHAFANRQIRTYAQVLELPSSFSILDSADAAQTIRQCAKSRGVYDLDKRFPRKNTLRDIISKSTNRQLSIEKVLANEYLHFVDYAGEIAAIQKEYTHFKVNAACLDLDDLLVYLDILLEEPEIRARIAAQYRYVMVDEYQDTNGIQGNITYLLGKEHSNVMVVGDDAQSIYRFRGAEPKNIFEFPNRFPGCRTVTLEQNYRSTQTILDVANAVLGNMKRKYSKCLTAATGQTGTKPELLFFRDAQEEAEAVADRIKQMRDDGIELRDQAVLYRASRSAIALQLALNARDIPFQVFGGLRMSETAHVKDVVAHLRLLVNVKDQLSWDRVLNLLDGVGRKTAWELCEQLVAMKKIGEAAAKLGQEAGCRRRAKVGLDALAKMFVSADGVRGSVGGQYELVLDYYKTTLQQRYDDWPRRQEDLEMLGQIASKYVKLEDFLADISIDPPELSADRPSATQRDDEEPLTLSTIHSAKGLEWRVVFILGVAEGVMPNSRSLEDAEEIEEEHRLCYVAVTRAKRQLFLTMSGPTDIVGRSGFGRLSRFIAAPNVLMKLEKSSLTAETPIQASTWAEDEPSLPVLGREGLLKRLLRRLQP